MKTSTAAISLVLATALASAPLASASARGWDHWHRGGHWGGPGPVVGVGAAVVGAAAALVTAPFAILGALAAPPESVAVAPAPVAYAPAAPAYGYGYGYAAPVAYPAPVYAVPAYGYPVYYGGYRGHYWRR